MTREKAIIRTACFPDDAAAVRELFREYQASIGVSLCFQGFEQELAALPGAYGSPHGDLLLAADADQALGCVALRPIADGVCEMKRLYVRPAARGLGLGRSLALRILESAVARDYRSMRLDTLASMTAARALYAALGFHEIGAYYENPLADVVYMEKSLKDRT